MTASIKGIVFDLDGTLIHSTIDFVKMKRRMIKILEENNIPRGIFSPQQTTVVIQSESENIWKKQKKTDAEKIEIRKKIEKIMNQGELEAIPEIKEIEGTANTLKAFKKKGFKLAILTRSHHAYAVEALIKIRIHQYFDLILGRDETPKPKPYAEALQHTSMLMGLGIDEILFVGDNHIDYQSAVNAGCSFVGVRTGPRGEQSWRGNRPEVLIDSVVDLLGYIDGV